MEIGIILNPETHKDWRQIEALLAPAAMRGGVPILEANEIVWAIDNSGIVGAATTRLTNDGFGEVILVGGIDCRKWIHRLDYLIGQWMRDEGMFSVRAYGRNGWIKILNGWRVIGGDDGAVGYERPLNV